MQRSNVLWTLLILIGTAACSSESDSSSSREAERIQAHLMTVAADLRTRPTEHLSRVQKQARLETIEWLDQYARQGIFPHNHVLPNRATPVFVDAHGTPCAVGYLLLRSGESQLVTDVIEADNLVRVVDLAGEPRLEQWLEERGLTLAEAEWIQPAYGGFPPDDRDADRSTYAGVTVSLSVLTAAVSSYAAFTDADPTGSPWVETLGAVTALSHLAMIFAGTGRENRDPGWSKKVNAVGAVLATLVTADRVRRRANARAPTQGVRAAPIADWKDDRLKVGVTITH